MRRLAISAMLTLCARGAYGAPPDPWLRPRSLSEPRSVNPAALRLGDWDGLNALMATDPAFSTRVSELRSSRLKYGVGAGVLTVAGVVAMGIGTSTTVSGYSSSCETAGLECAGAGANRTVGPILLGTGVVLALIAIATWYAAPGDEQFHTVVTGWNKVHSDKPVALQP